MENTSSQPDSEFLAYIVKQIVNKPEEVEVERKIDEMGVLLELRVAREDMGRVVGKNGQTAKSLRILLRVIGSRNNARVNMKILEPKEDGSSPAPSEDSSSPAPASESKDDFLEEDDLSL